MAKTYSFILIFLVVGLLMLYQPLKMRIKSAQAVKWPKVKGRILTSETLENRLRTATGRIGVGFSPVITYGYHVNMQDYTGDQIALGDLSFSYIIAQKVCAKFPVDAPVDVTYNPENPAEAFLAPQSTEGMKSIVPGIFVIVVGVIVSIIAFMYP